MKKKLIFLGVLLTLGSFVFGYWWIVKRPLAVSADIRTSIVERYNIQIYEGLPHQFLEPDLLEKERSRKDIVLFGEFNFYTPSLKLTPLQQDTLVAVISSNDSIRPFSGEKKCGGFHPDYRVSWSTDRSENRALICFGCTEVIFISGRNSYRYDLAHDARIRLQGALQPLASKRPRQTKNPIPPE